MLEARMVKSLSAKIREDQELEKLLALIVKLSALSRIPPFEIFPDAAIVKAPPETMLFVLVKLTRFKDKSPFD